MRWVLVVVSFSVLLSACSSQTQCLDTCAGCCSAAGVCSAGASDAECGKLGASCVACTAGKTCSAGVCRSAPMGGGGGTTGGGGGLVGGGTGGGAMGGGGGSATDGGATDGGATDAGTDAGVDAGVRVANPRLFVTMGTFNGDLQTQGRSTDQLVAGDTICNDAAADAGLGGVWRAMIAVGIDSAFTRINPGAPYRLVGSGTQVFRTPQRLAQLPEVPINRNEFGQVVAASAVWTATELTGLNNAVSCIDWNSASMTEPGSVGFTNDAGAWTGAGSRTCDSRARLYCFEF